MNLKAKVKKKSPELLKLSQTDDGSVLYINIRNIISIDINFNDLTLDISGNTYNFERVYKNKDLLMKDIEKLDQYIKI